MSVKTIECRIVAQSKSLQYLWELMTQKNTPLINELLAQVPNHPNFEEWLHKGNLPKKAIKQLCAPLRKQEPFVNQPGRFYDSAIAIVHNMFGSWLKVQKDLRGKIKGKERWLAMLRSDVELEEECGKDITEIRLMAAKLLKEVEDQLNCQKTPGKKRRKKRKKSQSKTGQSTIFGNLFDQYDKTNDIFTKCALAFLLKNSCQVDEDEEEPEKYALRRRKKEIEIQRLKKQLRSHLPSGRELRSESLFKTLDEINNNYVPDDNVEAKSLQDELLKKSASVPYPVNYESNTDLTWLEHDRGNLCVKFNGLGKHEFEIRCDIRQLDWFKRFLEDQKLKKISNKEKKQGLRDSELSSALFALRSGRILWRKGQKQPDRRKKIITLAFLLLFQNKDYKLVLTMLQGYKQLKRRIRTEQPWNFHNLYFQCSIDTRLWTAEGTTLVAQEKTATSHQNIAQTEDKGDLDPEQQKHIKRKQTEIANLINLPERPHKTLYQGNPSIIVGVSLGLKKPATVAVVDVVSGRVLTYRSSKQLLGNDYKLLDRQRREKQRLSIKRHKAQKRNAPNSFGESELGKYIDRLLAAAIVKLAQSYQASSIVLPELSQMREITQSEVQAKAEKKALGYIEGQKKYAKQYRINLHNWSYGRLIDFISQKANITGIALERARQPLKANNYEKAKLLAIAAYKSRIDKAV